MLQNKKNIYPKELTEHSGMKLNIALSLLFLGVIAVYYKELGVWFLKQSIAFELAIIIISMIVLFLFIIYIKNLLSLNYYGDTALEITSEHLAVGAKLEAIVHLDGHFKAKDLFTVTLKNIYTYNVQTTVYGERTTDEETNTIWEKTLETEVKQEGKDTFIEFFFNLDINEGQVETKKLHDKSHYNWELTVNSSAGKYNFYRTYPLLINKI